MQGIIIDTSSVVVTLNCNLNCKLCNTGVPYRKKPVRFSTEFLKLSIERYFRTVDFARKFSFTGGEPFLREDLAELTAFTQGFDNQFDVLEIVTNGTIMPSEATLQVFEKFRSNVFILIDEYGDLSVNADKLSNALAERSVNHLVRKYSGASIYQNGWVDLTQFKKYNTPEQAKIIYKKCAVPNKLKKISGGYRDVKIDENTCFGVYTVLINGVVYRCMRPFIAMERGIDFNKEHQFVDIVDNNKTTETIREEIITMFNLEYPSICEYCPGMCDDSKRYIPAEQA